MPYVVGKKAAAPQGSTVVFTVTGDTPIVATVGVEGPRRAAPRSPTDPSARLTIDRRTFTRLAGGRWTGDEARARGSLEVEGDTELGDRVVDNLAFTL